MEWLPNAADMWLFVAAVAVLNATPGVDFALTVTRTLQAGPRAGVFAALGIGAGCALHACTAAFGLAALLAVSPAWFALLKVAGAAYLVYLAWGLWRSASATVAAAASVPAASVRSAWAEFRLGLLTNVLNPKVALFFLSFLPQFIAPHADDKTLRFLALGAWFVVQGTLFLLGLVWVASRLRSLAGRPSGVAWVKRGGALLFVALAARLVGAKA